MTSVPVLKYVGTTSDGSLPAGAQVGDIEVAYYVGSYNPYRPSNFSSIFSSFNNDLSYYRSIGIRWYDGTYQTLPAESYTTLRLRIFYRPIPAITENEFISGVIEAGELKTLYGNETTGGSQSFSVSNAGPPGLFERCLNFFHSTTSYAYMQLGTHDSRFTRLLYEYAYRGEDLVVESMKSDSLADPVVNITQYYTNPVYHTYLRIKHPYARSFYIPWTFNLSGVIDVDVERLTNDKEGSFSLELVATLSATGANIPTLTADLPPLDLVAAISVTAIKEEVADEREVELPNLPLTAAVNAVVSKAASRTAPLSLASALALVKEKATTFPCPDLAHASELLLSGRKGHVLGAAWPMVADVLLSTLSARAWATSIPHQSTVDAAGFKAGAAIFSLEHVSALLLEYDKLVTGWVLENVSAIEAAGFKGSSIAPSWPLVSLVGGHFRKGALFSNNFDMALVLDIDLLKATRQGFLWDLDHEFIQAGLAARLFEFGIELVFDAEIGRYMFVPFRKKLFLQAAKNERRIDCAIGKKG